MLSYFASPDLAGQILTFTHRREMGEPVRMLLAEGDSWFSIGGATSSLLMAMDDDDTLIVSCASPGDTMRNMVELANNPLWMMLDPRFGATWDAVLLSAGGNDLLGDVGLMLSGGDFRRDLLTARVEKIERDYRLMVEQIRRRHAGPIHAHTYDYPVSDPFGGWFRAGPWVGNTLLAYGVPQARHKAIIHSIIDALAVRLLGIEGLIVHDTRGTLAPGKWWGMGWQKHWKNEIHATPAGYRLLASKWSQNVSSNR